MSITCKNCGNEFEGNYCNNCGQSANTERLDVSYIKHHFHIIFLKYFHKGIIYTVKQLYTRPGHSIREYVEGKRVMHFEPFALLVTLAALYGLLYHAFNIDIFQNATIDTQTNGGNISLEILNGWFIDHYSIVSLVVLPIFAFGSYVCFYKQRYNFIEHVVINAFLSSQRLLFRIATFPILAVIYKTPNLHTFLNSLILVDIVLMAWAYTQFFCKMKVFRAIVLSMLSYGIYVFLLLALFVLILNVISMFV